MRLSGDQAMFLVKPATAGHPGRQTNLPDRYRASFGCLRAFGALIAGSSGPSWMSTAI